MHAEAGTGAKLADSLLQEQQTIVHQRLGRFMLRVQRYEMLLKALVVDSVALGTVETAPLNQQRRKEMFASKPMGYLFDEIKRVQQLQADIGLIERRLSQQMREIPACKVVAEIPGTGLLTATAVVASMGTPTACKDAREFAAWIGLVPRQTRTGGRVRQLGISKRGDAYLRTLLMHGARAVVIRSKDGPTCSRGRSGQCWQETKPGAPGHGRPRTDDEESKITKLKESKRPRV